MGGGVMLGFKQQQNHPFLQIQPIWNAPIFTPSPDMQWSLAQIWNVPLWLHAQCITICMVDASIEIDWVNIKYTL